MTIASNKRHEIIRLGQRRVHASNSSCSTHSCSSTISALAQAVKVCPPKASHRRVHFCEDSNEYYTNSQVTKEDCANAWYSQEDLKSFKAETGRLARGILHSPDAKHEEWMSRLIEAFDGLCQANTTDDMQCILENCHLIEIDSSVLGLEKWCLRPVVHDKAARRNGLHKFIRVWNQDGTSSHSHKSKLLRKASRELSRPSRLFAHHVALAVSSGER